MRICKSEYPFILCDTAAQGDPQIVNGWCCREEHASANLPLRYCQQKFSSADVQTSAFSSLATPFYPAPSPSDAAASTGTSVAVLAALSDVTQDVREYETFAKSFSRASARASQLLVNVEMAVGSGRNYSGRTSVVDVPTKSSFASNNNTGSFMQHLRGKMSQNRRTGLFSGSSICVDEPATEVHLPSSQNNQRGLREPLLPSLASRILNEDVLHDDDHVSSSRIGVFQFIDACNLRCLLILLALLYPCYQLLRTYISFWTVFWQREAFGLSSTMHAAAFAAIVVGLIAVRLVTDYIFYHRGVKPPFTRPLWSSEYNYCNTLCRFSPP